ncbi:MAG: hypothetical protein A2W19_15250 [Spirochaetes bacterium RBG_16_49_21]|nr:MAG: hypothetical protein A2W19_15250 [Spirochaetes bacterium RBG_16_49_21]
MSEDSEAQGRKKITAIPPGNEEYSAFINSSISTIPISALQALFQFINPTSYRQTAIGESDMHAYSYDLRWFFLNRIPGGNRIR